MDSDSLELSTSVMIREQTYRYCQMDVVKRHKERYQARERWAGGTGVAGHLLPEPAAIGTRDPATSGPDEESRCTRRTSSGAKRQLHMLE